MYLISPIQYALPLSSTQTLGLANRTNKTQAEAAALPIIATLGNQTRITGDSAAPACGVCWAACLAGPQAPFCAALCAAMCVSPLAAK